MLSVHLIPPRAGTTGSPAAFVDACSGVIASEPRRWSAAESIDAADLAVAPLLTRRLSTADLLGPRLGVLVFHPSLLPLRRGPDAMRWAVNSGDAWTGATWFWADAELDGGDICEQQLVALDTAASPGRNYHDRVAPAGLAGLRRALDGISSGFIRRVPQDHAAATYQSWWRPLEGSESMR